MIFREVDRTSSLIADYDTPLILWLRCRTVNGLQTRRLTGYHYRSGRENDRILPDI